MAARAPGAGRPRKPTNIRILEGNRGRRPIPQDEPKPKPRLPRMPAELGAAAKKEWHRTGKALLALGVMTELDGAMLSAFVQPYTQWLEVAEMLNKTGPIIKNQKTGEFRVNPLHRLANELQAQWTRALTEFGMSPSSRSRIHVTPPVEEADPLERLRMRGAE